MGSLLILPALALAGVLQSESSHLKKSGPVELDVTYHRILRDRSDQPLVVRAANASGKVINKLTVTLSREYVSDFDQVEFQPEPDRLTSDEVVFEFDNVEPGQARDVVFDFQADRPGRKSGIVRASADGASTSLDFSTFVLP